MHAPCGEKPHGGATTAPFVKTAAARNNRHGLSIGLHARAQPKRAHRICHAPYGAKDWPTNDCAVPSNHGA